MLGGKNGYTTLLRPTRLLISEKSATYLSTRLNDLTRLFGRLEYLHTYRDTLRTLKSNARF